MKKILARMLRASARAVLRKHRPQIIAITGSVGKTSAKEAIFCALAGTFRVRKSSGNYNNEIGVPLAIIDTESGGKSISGWLTVLVKTWTAYFAPDYPQILILEYGADKPGDIEYLMRLAPPAISVLTAIEKVHLENFGTIEAVAQEKSKIVRMIKKDGHVVLNADDERVKAYADQSPASVMTYGYRTNADVHASSVAIMQKNGILGLEVTIQHQTDSSIIFIPGTIAPHQVYSILAGYTVGTILGVTSSELVKALASFESPHGRTNLIEGIEDMHIIDDTYNGSPVSARAALKIFNNLDTVLQGRRIGIFGDMLELGEYEKEGHESVGREAAAAGVTELITIGVHAKVIGTGAKAAGMSADQIHSFDTQADALEYITGILKPNDIILVKGSQGARMERIVKALMAHPEQATQKLVRQSSRWLSKD